MDETERQEKNAILLARLHRLAEDDNPRIAAMARLTLRLIPAVEDWMKDERSRAVPFDAVVFAATHSVGHLLYMVTASLTGCPALGARTLRAIENELCVALRRARNGIKKGEFKHFAGNGDNDR